MITLLTVSNFFPLKVVKNVKIITGKLKQLSSEAAFLWH